MISRSWGEIAFVNSPPHLHLKSGSSRARWSPPDLPRADQQQLERDTRPADWLDSADSPTVKSVRCETSAMSRWDRRSVKITRRDIFTTQSVLAVRLWIKEAATAPDTKLNPLKSSYGSFKMHISLRFRCCSSVLFFVSIVFFLSVSDVVARNVENSRPKRTIDVKDHSCEYVKPFFEVRNISSSNGDGPKGNFLERFSELSSAVR